MKEFFFAILKECKFCCPLKWILINCETILQWRRDISFVFCGKKKTILKRECKRERIKKKLDQLKIRVNKLRTRFFESNEKWRRIQMKKATFFVVVNLEVFFCVTLNSWEVVKNVTYGEITDVLIFTTFGYISARFFILFFHSFFLFSPTQINDTFKCFQHSFSFSFFDLIIHTSNSVQFLTKVYFNCP